MVWFKVDDSLDLHPKVLRAGNSAMGLWVRAGAYAMRQLTDGFLPTGVAMVLGTESEIASLVAAGLWRQVDGGFEFVGFTEVQRTREQVEHERQLNAERQRRFREKGLKAIEDRRNGVTDGGTNGPRNGRNGVTNDGSNGGSNDLPDQTRPVTSNDVKRAKGASDTPSSEFVQFWNAYGKKVDRPAALRAWQGAIKKASPEAIIAAAEALVRRLDELGKREFQPYPATWLNGERWNDDLPTGRPTVGSQGASVHDRWAGVRRLDVD